MLELKVCSTNPDLIKSFKVNVFKYVYRVMSDHHGLILDYLITLEETISILSKLF